MNSHTDLVGKPDVLKREVTILNFLREQSEGVSAREIYEAVKATLDDTISRPAYYKILDRLVASGKVDQIDDQATRRYIMAPQLHSTNRLTLDDVYEMLPFVESTETMANALEAQEYFLQNRETILRQTGNA